MIKFFNDFLLMLQFFTRIPVNFNLSYEKENFRKGAVYTPVVGLIIGCIQWITFYFLNKVLPASITAVFVVLISVLITGALHVDGLGDTCDGFFAFKGKDRIIEIMKDSRIGTFACIAICMDMLLKVLAVAYIIEYKSTSAIIAAPVIARSSVVLLAFIGKNAKPSGSGNLFIGNITYKIAALASMIAILATSLLLGVGIAVFMYAVVSVVTMLINKYSESKIDGITGDILGANNELIEILVLMLCIGLVKF
jgi:adenosylcobinamide-GDP ribazoletransferase